MTASSFRFSSSGAGNVLAVLQLELALHATGDGQIAVLGQLPEVAGAEGTGLDDDLLGLLGLVPVALHDVGAGHDDLALVGAVGIVPGRGVDGHLVPLRTLPTEFKRDSP